MATLNALKKAPVLNEAGATMATGYTITSSDPAIAKVQTFAGVPYVVGVTAGTVIVTAKRTLDGAVATLDVEVLPVAVPFSISLGAESPA